MLFNYYLDSSFFLIKSLFKQKMLYILLANISFSFNYPKFQAIIINIKLLTISIKEVKIANAYNI
jgi:hypothetical protein